MSNQSNQGWSRIQVQATSVTSEHSTHLKWRAFLFSLILFVFLEVAVVMYAGIGSAGHLSAARTAPNVRMDTVQDLRTSLGLVTGNETNGNHGAAFMFGNSSMTYETFAEHYGELCERYFIPRTINANEKFLGLFGKITAGGDRMTANDESSSMIVPNGPSDNIDTISKHVDNTNDVLIKPSAISNGVRRDVYGRTEVPACPCTPSMLVGKQNVSLEVPYIGELELAHPDIQNGGHWSPRDCLARHRTAVIIPFRDREEHLRILLNYLHPMLQRQMLYYTIFVVEQVFPLVFNKASIMNVGYREAILADSFDCFIFHDVDMIPENDENFYTCTPQPRHVGSHCDKFNYEVPYQNIFGGVTAFTSTQFIKANGFSNEFYGWGGEDDDMFQRIKASGMTISRFPGSIARYTMIKHGSDVGNPYNSRSYVAWQSRPKHYRQNGLNTLRYYKREMEQRPMYTWLLVELPDAPAQPNVANNRAKKSAASFSNVPSQFHSLVLVVLITTLVFC